MTITLKQSRYLKSAALLAVMALLTAFAAAQTSTATTVKAKDKTSKEKVDTDSIISSISASERTRPFPVGEKTAYFVNIKDGDQVKSPFRVAFAVTGMGVAPVVAGDIPDTGHHHILIDMPMPEIGRASCRERV